MNKELINFTKRLLIFVLLFLIIDRGLGYLVGYLFYNKKNSNTAVTTYAILKTHEDLLVYGSSRAAHHYDSRVLETYTGLSSFNCGKDGANIIYASTILPSALERHTPKAIILDVTANDLSAVTFLSGKGNKKSEMITALLLPYINKSKEIEKAVYEIDYMEVYKAKASLLYSYNSVILQILANKAGGDKTVIKGFQPLIGSKVSETLPAFTEYKPVDPLSQNKLASFVRMVVSRQIPLYVVISPMYYQPFKNTPSMDSICAVLARYHIPLWDYSLDTCYKKKELFYDNGHMNITGTEKFSSDLALRIKQDLALRKKASQPLVFLNQIDGKNIFPSLRGSEIFVEGQ
jgi:hypothetical protein